ncbi:ankyrin, partial [Anaeromyces robustus]
MVQLLIENGAKVEEVAIIMYAIIIGNLEIFKFILNYAIHINFGERYHSNSMVKSVDKSGKTEIFEYLVQCNMDDFNDKIIKNIISNNNLNLLKILVNYKFDINTKDDEGNTPLAYAIICSNLNIVDYLINNGADLYSINKEGQTIKDLSYQYSYDYW